MLPLGDVWRVIIRWYELDFGQLTISAKENQRQNRPVKDGFLYVLHLSVFESLIRSNQIITFSLTGMLANIPTATNSKYLTCST